MILNWNQPTMTLDCVRHLLATQPSDVHSVLVIDNGSEPASSVVLQDGLPTGVGLVLTGRNLGFAGGMNVGIRCALQTGAEYVWLLNNDAFPDPGCLSWLVASLDVDARAGAVTPLLYGQDGVEQHAGAEIVFATAEHCVRRAADLTNPLNDQAVWLTGTAPLVRVAALQAVGLLDERYFAYWEDVELCFRLRRAGFRLRAVPAARCLHIGSVSTGGAGTDTPFSIYMMTRNGFRFFAVGTAGRGRVGVFARRALWQAADEYRRGQVRQAEARIAGIWAALHREVGPPIGFHRSGWGVWLTVRVIARIPWRIRRFLDAVVQPAAGYREAL